VKTTRLPDRKSHLRTESPLTFIFIELPKTFHELLLKEKTAKPYQLGSSKEENAGWIIPKYRSINHPGRCTATGMEGFGAAGCWRWTPSLTQRCTKKSQTGTTADNS